MKTFKKTFWIATCVGVLAASATPVFGINVYFTIDNIGDAYFTPSLMYSHTQGTDPVSGLTTLEYNLPFAGTAGDVLMEESASGPVTDLLRFDGSGDVYFFSTDGVGTPAYVSALPSVISPSQGPLLPESPESMQSFTFSYSPTPGQPGYNSETVYNIVVNVPEPSVLALGTLGGGLLLLLSSRRRARCG
ncbi:MAG: PEP-CTERM sorting domain-containing protein [Verrucomicrobiia bacterium]